MSSLCVVEVGGAVQPKKTSYAVKPTFAIEDGEACGVQRPHQSFAMEIMASLTHTQVQGYLLASEAKPVARFRLALRNTDSS